MVTTPKFNNSKKNLRKGKTKLILDVLWRPPKGLIMIFAATIIFSLAGFAALRLSDAMTEDRNTDNRSVVKIMPLGDSVTAGDNGLPNAYRLALWHKLVDNEGMKIDYVGTQSSGTSALPDKDHEGHEGWHIDRLNQSIATWLEAEKPDVVLLQVGASDLLDGASTAEVTSRLNTLLNTISSMREVKVYVGSITPLSSETGWDRQKWQEYNATIPKLVAAFQQREIDMTFIDFNQDGKGVGQQDMTGNGVYLTNSGYEKMATGWRDELVLDF